MAYQMFEDKRYKEILNNIIAILETESAYVCFKIKKQASVLFILSFCSVLCSLVS